MSRRLPAKDDRSTKTQRILTAVRVVAVQRVFDGVQCDISHSMMVISLISHRLHVAGIWVYNSRIPAGPLIT
jgi:hypothetical protein